jgi:hypothetical protein
MYRILQKTFDLIFNYRQVGIGIKNGKNYHEPALANKSKLVVKAAQLTGIKFIIL